ncbi:hypothetical protein SAMN05444339_1335 [Loktanella atrilutea]|uniref:Uncharacterized protein n=1 Tax=Loktanella atrilutea TaxID=366533 RepID=A0A1M5G307_LOKAT|nr:hypothetical protein SAMN05444339_1335 [Loktanella atrilutea]
MATDTTNRDVTKNLRKHLLSTSSMPDPNQFIILGITITIDAG